MKANDTWPGAFAALKLAFAGIKKNPEPMLAIVAIYGLSVLADAYTHFTLVSIGAFKIDDPFVLLVPLIVTLAQTAYALSVADKRPLAVSQMFNGSLKKYVSLIMAYILLLIIVLASCVVLAIPLFWFIPWFNFIFYVIVDQGVGPFAAFPASKRLAEHYEGKVWGVIGVTILMSIATIAVAFIPVLSMMVSAFASVLSYAMTAMLYRWLQRQAGIEAPMPSDGDTVPLDGRNLRPPLPPTS